MRCSGQEKGTKDNGDRGRTNARSSVSMHASLGVIFFFFFFYEGKSKESRITLR